MKLDLVELIKDNTAHGKTTKLSYDQFLLLTLKQNHVPRTPFTKEILGKSIGYLTYSHIPHKHFASKSCENGFPEDVAEKLAPVFKAPPYNTSEFWMQGTHTIGSLDDVPIINKDKLPESAKKDSRGGWRGPQKTVDAPFINEGRTAGMPSKNAGERDI